MVTTILPGTYITVRDEGLISASSSAVGNIGIVGTANKGAIDEVKIIGSFSEAKELFGESDSWQGGKKDELTLIRSLELVYNNGGKTVYVVRVAKDASCATATFALGKLGINLIANSEGTWGNEIKLATAYLTDTKQLKVIINYRLTNENYIVPLTNIAELSTVIEKLKTAINKQSKLVKLSPTEYQPPTNAKALTELTEITNSETLFTGGKNGENASKKEYAQGLQLLENEIVNIVLIAGQNQETSWAVELLEGHLNSTEQIKRERIGIIGSGTDELSTIGGHSFNNDRLIFTAPGILMSGKEQVDKLHGGYLACAVAGLISSLPVQTSPTNKTLTIGGLTTYFTSSQLENLVSKKVLVAEKREGLRIVKGITTDDGAWKQITTRRIVDSAIYGVRSACNPYIGKLNNERVRGAMKATLDAFLTRMVRDEALVGYTLSVSATRGQEIAGEVMVDMTLQPTFSIDYIKVTMYLG